MLDEIDVSKCDGKSLRKHVRVLQSISKCFWIAEVRKSYVWRLAPDGARAEDVLTERNEFILPEMHCKRMPC